MINEFKEFIAKGNVMDLAVGIILGAAFTAIVTSLVDDMINPLIGLVIGGIDFSTWGFKVGEAAFNIGNFINAIIKFFIVAWVVFLLVKGVNRMKEGVAKKEAAVEAAKGPSQEELLVDIRDLLKARA